MSTRGLNQLRQNTIWILLAGMVVLGVGCTKGEGPKSTVSGTVTLDGKPMAEGEVSFIIMGKPPELMTVSNGTFQGQAQVGKHRIEIRAYRMGQPYFMGTTKFEASRENYLPGRYNSESKLTAEVTSTGPNEFKWEVQSQ